MERFKDMDKWRSAIGEAEKKVQELKRAVPLWWETWQWLQDLALNGMSYETQEWSRSHRGKDKVRKKVPISTIVERWKELSFNGSKKLWEQVKRYNSTCLVSKKIPTQEIYKGLKND
jgi:hypothetical protein